MTRLYRFLCLGLLGILLLAMVISLAGVIFFAEDSETNDEKMPLSALSLIDGSFGTMLEEEFGRRFPGHAFWTEEYEDLRDWYTLVDEAHTADIAE